MPRTTKTAYMDSDAIADCIATVRAANTDSGDQTKTNTVLHALAYLMAGRMADYPPFEFDGQRFLSLCGIKIDNPMQCCMCSNPARLGSRKCDHCRTLPEEV